MPLELPYVSKTEIRAYIQAHLQVGDTGEYIPEFQAYVDAIDCPNFNYGDVAICYRLGWTVEQASEALREQDRQDEIEARAVWAEEREYYDDQRNG